MHIAIEGPVGNLEARWTEAKSSIEVTALLCHPHPQYGGSMQDAVLETSANVLLDHGISCVRFNFRGVGASRGLGGVHGHERASRRRRRRQRPQRRKAPLQPGQSPRHQLPPLTR